MGIYFEQVGQGLLKKLDFLGPGPGSYQLWTFHDASRNGPTTNQRVEEEAWLKAGYSLQPTGVGG